jgi:hypothetical protein
MAGFCVVGVWTVAGAKDRADVKEHFAGTATIDA